MKKLFTLLIITTIAIGLFSCKDTQEYLDNACAIVYQDGIPYLINLEKETFSLAEYESIDDYFGDYIVAKKDGKYGIIKNNGEETSEFIFDQIFPIREGLAVAITDEKYIVINHLGETLYEFNNGMYSNSYFSEGELVVTKDDKYGYLKYENGTFTLSSLDYDYALPFYNNYAIIGKYEDSKEKENYKYDFYTHEGTELFGKFEFDFADYFYDGYARVGFYDDAKIFNYGDNKTLKLHTLSYSYIDKDGNYLTYTANLRRSYYIRDYSADSGLSVVPYTVNYNEIIREPYASNFHDGKAVVGSVYYYSYTNVYYKGFRFIDTDGFMEYDDYILNSTIAKIKYDCCIERVNAPILNIYMFQPVFGSNIVDLAMVDDLLTFRVCYTGNESNWHFFFADPETADNGFKEIHTFEKFLDVDYDQNNNPVTLYPAWLTTYAKEFFPNAVTLEQAYIASYKSINSPYETTNLFTTDYMNGLKISKVRIFNWDTYGILKFEKFIDEKGIAQVKATYLFDPIYDKIIL